MKPPRRAWRTAKRRPATRSAWWRRCRFDCETPASAPPRGHLRLHWHYDQSRPACAGGAVMAAAAAAAMAAAAAAAAAEATAAARVRLHKRGHGGANASHNQCASTTPVAHHRTPVRKKERGDAYRGADGSDSLEDVSAEERDVLHAFAAIADEVGLNLRTAGYTPKPGGRDHAHDPCHLGATIKGRRAGADMCAGVRTLPMCLVTVCLLRECCLHGVDRRQALRWRRA